jgi:hypothetical protein
VTGWIASITTTKYKMVLQTGFEPAYAFALLRREMPLH